jgi:hypothetical protein
MGLLGLAFGGIVAWVGGMAVGVGGRWGPSGDELAFRYSSMTDFTSSELGPWRWPTVAVVDLSNLIVGEFWLIAKAFDG